MSISRLSCIDCSIVAQKAIQNNVSSGSILSVNVKTESDLDALASAISDQRRLSRKYQASLQSVQLVMHCMHWLLTMHPIAFTVSSFFSDSMNGLLGTLIGLRTFAQA